MDKDWKITYEEMLNDDSITFEQTVEYVNQYMPKKLYAYKKFNDYWKSNLLKGNVHLTLASDFNDPYDCSVMVNLYGDQSYIGKSYTAMRREPKKYAKQIKQIEDRNELLSKKNQEKMKVACFTENNKSMLMWSHYADDHKGFCIEYDTSKHWMFKKLMLAVIYQEKRYNAVQALTDKGNINLVTNPFVYKYNVWTYENEWRMFINNNNKYFPYSDIDMKDSISAVYLGVNFKKNKDWQSYLTEIKTWGNTNNISIHMLHTSKFDYSLTE